jgi:hypothetical protein
MVVACTAIGEAIIALVTTMSTRVWTGLVVGREGGLRTFFLRRWHRLQVGRAKAMEVDDMVLLRLDWITKERPGCLLTLAG